MRKAKLLFFVILLCVGVAGCASLKKAMSDVTPEQQSQMTQQIATTAGPWIPQPYQIPATAILGWLACVGYNWFKEKTKPKA
jgi:hypothetical protein